MVWFCAGVVLFASGPGLPLLLLLGLIVVRWCGGVVLSVSGPGPGLLQLLGGQF